MSEFTNKTILITGATGLMGSSIAYNILKDENVKIIALGRNKKKLEKVFGNYIEDKRVTIIAQDVTVPIAQDMGCIDYIFHTASPISGNVIQKFPTEVIETNVIGTKNLLDYLKWQQEEKGVKGRLIIFSSATIYSNIGNHDICVNESETAIADTLDAINSPYSESKRFIEVLAKSYTKQYGIETVIARFSYIYGPAIFMPNTAFYEFIKKAKNGDDILLNNSDIARRDNIYVEDAVKGVLLVATKGISGKSYNISSNGDKNNFKAVDEMAVVISEVFNKLMKKDIKVKYSIEKSNHRKVGICMDNSNLKSLGWNIEYSIFEGIKKTIEYYLDKEE